MERDGRRERCTGKGEQMHALDCRRVTDWRKRAQREIFMGNELRKWRVEKKDY